jgi:hypothetical protein
MKVLLTPVGPSDKVVEWIPRNCGLIPSQAHVNIVICGDGKLTNASFGCRRIDPLDLEYYKRLMFKMCKLGNDVVETVTCVAISFFEDEDVFHNKVRIADVFFMAGFTSMSPIIEKVFCRSDHSMTLKRHAVGNRIARNKMSFWGVCGSAVACGVSWDMSSISSRVLQHQKYQMLEVLADGNVDYQSSSGAGNIQVTQDMTQWHITSGTGCVIVATPATRHGEAFVCVKKGYTAYQEKCNEITAKMKLQIERLYSCASYYRSDSQVNSHVWRLLWGTGQVEWPSEEEFQEARKSMRKPAGALLRNFVHVSFCS